MNALFAADVARSVTGVDLNPRALSFARFNEALNPPTRALAYEEGSLFEPLEPGRRFDTILVKLQFDSVIDMSISLATIVRNCLTRHFHSDCIFVGRDDLRFVIGNKAP